MRAFAASLFVVLVLAACSDQDRDSAGISPSSDAATATPTTSQGGPAIAAPPSAYLKDRVGTAVEGGTGTYCWRSASLMQCVDYTGPRTNVNPIPVAGGEIVELVFDAGSPRDVKLWWVPAEEWKASGQGPLDWSPKDAATYHGPQYTDSRSAPSQPGLYVLSAFTLFPEGDVSYGFYVDVR